LLIQIINNREQKQGLIIIFCQFPILLSGVEPRFSFSNTAVGRAFFGLWQDKKVSNIDSSVPGFENNFYGTKDETKFYGTDFRKLIGPDELMEQNEVGKDVDVVNDVNE